MKQQQQKQKDMYLKEQRCQHKANQRCKNTKNYDSCENTQGEQLRCDNKIKKI